MPNERLVLEVAAKAIGQESIDSLTSALNKFSASADNAGKARGGGGLRDIGDAAEHAIPRMAAASAAVRTLDGSLSVRAAERFLSDILKLGPALEAAFPIVGAIAFGEVILQGAERLKKFADSIDPAVQAEKRLVETTKELGKAIQSLGEDIRKADLDSLTDALGVPAGKVAGASAQQSRGLGNAIFAEGLRRQLSEAQSRKTAAERIISRQGAEIEPGQQSVFSAAASSAREADADIKNLTLQLQAFTLQQVRDQQTVSKLVHEGTEDQLAQNKKKADDIKQKADEAARKAKEINDFVNTIARKGAEASLGPVGRLLSERDADLSRFPLKSGQIGSVEFSFQQQIGAALAKEAEAQAKLPLQIGAQGRITANGLTAEDNSGLGRRNSQVVADLKNYLADQKQQNEDLKKKDEANFSGIRSGADQQAQLTQLLAKPGDELTALRQGLDIRKQAAAVEFSIKEQHSQIYDLDVERAKLNKENADAEFKYTEAIIQLRNKQIADFRENVVRGFDDLISGNGGNILKSFATGIERQVVGNAAELIFPQVQKLTSGLHVSSDSTFGKLLKGTPFGADPLKTATDANTLATQANTAALTRAVSVSATGGGGLAGTAGSVFSGVSSGNPFVFNATGGAALGEDGLPIYNSPQYSGKTLPSFSGPSSGFGSFGKIAGFAAAGGGAFAAINDFRTGGAKNDIAGVGAGLGSAAGIAALIPGGQVAALGLGIASLATSFIASILPDPKKVKEQSIAKELEQGKYYAPTALNISQDTSGNYVDFDARGNLRQSGFRAVPQVSQPYQYWGPNNTPYDVPGSVNSPYSPSVTINIQAADASSFVDMARRNSAGLADVVADHVQGTEGRLSQAIAYRVSR